MPASFNQTGIATILGRGIHVSGGVLVPQLAGELIILRLGAVTQYGTDVGATRATIRRRSHERDVDVHVHLAEERMEPVIHRFHRCIGGEVGADSSNHLSSNKQIGVGKMEVGISCSRYHEFKWAPESRDVKGWCSLQRSSSILVCVGGTAKMSSSLFTLSHVRTPYYESTSVRCRRLMVVTRRRGAARFIRFILSVCCGWRRTSGAPGSHVCALIPRAFGRARPRDKYLSSLIFFGWCIQRRTWLRRVQGSAGVLWEAVRHWPMKRHSLYTWVENDG